MNKAISLGTSTSLVRLIHVGYTAFNVSVRTEQQLKYGALVFQLPAATTLEAIEALLPWNLKAVLEARKRKQ